MAETLYLVSVGAQKAEIKEYCFDKCGMILMGGVRIVGRVFRPCSTAKCDHEADTMNLSGYELPYDQRKLVIRKLIEVEK